MVTSNNQVVFTVPVGTQEPRISQHNAGEMFYDSLAGEMKVYTGKTWVKISEYSRMSEKDIEDMLCERHPGLKELRNLRDKNPESIEAKEKFEAYKALVKE